MRVESEKDSAEQEGKYHTYVSHVIPWYIRLRMSWRIFFPPFKRNYWPPHESPEIATQRLRCIRLLRLLRLADRRRCSG